MISSIANLVYELPHKLPNDLRLRILGNQEILGKSHIWVETLNLGSSSQKTRKSRYQTLLPLSTFTRFPHPVPNIPPRTVGQCNEGIFLVNFEITHHINALFSETYLGPYQTYMMELFAK